MRTATFALTALFLAGWAAPAFAQTNVTGDWEVTIQSAQGSNTVRVSFTQDGEKLSGVFKSQMGELPFEGGSMIGNDLKFGFTIPIQGQPLEITMTGRVDGASIAGKAQFGGFGEGEWTAKRIEAGATAATPPAAPPDATAAGAGGAAPTQGGLSGKWDVTVKTQMGDVAASAELSESAGKVAGTFTGPLGAVDLSGTVEGNAIKLAFVAKTPQGDIPVSLTGDLDGDAIVNGKAEFGGMGQGEWSAKRKQ